MYFWKPMTVLIYSISNFFYPVLHKRSFYFLTYITKTMKIIILNKNYKTLQLLRVHYRV